MSRKDLRDLAAKFKHDEAADTPTPTPAEDVTAQIERRLAEARKPATEPLVDEAPYHLAGTPTPSASSTPGPPAQAGTPTLRDTDPRQRVPVDIPAVFEPMRQRASDSGMTLTTLVLTAIRAEGAALAERAVREGLVPVKGAGFKRWTLLLSDSELEELDDLTTALERALGRRSRAKSIALALDAHSRS